MSPRERPRIRNFLVCVFLAQVKWIAPISALRGQLHYMKETVTLNVTVQQPQSTPRLPGRQAKDSFTSRLTSEPAIQWRRHELAGIANHEHPVGRWGPRLAVRSSASGSWGIRPMLQTARSSRSHSKDQSGSFDELTPEGAKKGSMSSGSPAMFQPGLTPTGISVTKKTHTSGQSFCLDLLSKMVWSGGSHAIADYTEIRRLTSNLPSAVWGSVSHLE
ncbi:hypothetical protein PAMP_019752 [Pampus punctatissimus]